MNFEQRFKPEEHFLLLKGKQYLPTAWRLVWFRQDHPGGHIVTELLEHDAAAGLAVFKATVSYMDAAGDGPMASGTGHGSETRKDFGDYLEKAETKAIGRALAVLGYGTQFAQELDEGLEKGGLSAAADSPVQPRQQAQRAVTAHEPRTGAIDPTVQTNDQAADAALTTMQKRLHAAAQSDKEAQTELLHYLKEQGKTRISELTMGEVTEWMLYLNDRATSPDAPVQMAVTS
jgi:hypothetical protein